MRLGRAEKAESGIDKIVSGWKYFGRPTPTVMEEIFGIEKILMVYINPLIEESDLVMHNWINLPVATKDVSAYRMGIRKIS